MEHCKKGNFFKTTNNNPRVRHFWFFLFFFVIQFSFCLNAYSFNDPLTAPTPVLDDSTEAKRNRAHQLLEDVVSSQRFVEMLSSIQEIELPVGVAKSGGAIDYSILIDRITFTREGAMMEVYMSLELPQTGDRLAFNGKVPLSASGGIAGNAKIYLLGNHYVKINNSTLVNFKGNTGNATDGSFVEFDCNGFVGLGLEVEVEFSRDFIVPEDPNGKVLEGDARIKTAFSTYLNDFNNLMVGVSLPPFQVTGLKDFGFTVEQAFLDWSDLANPEGMVFPPNYSNPFTDAGMGQLWRGFYLKKLEIRLPEGFQDREANNRVTLGAENMLLDEQGFTGEVFAENVVEKGSMNGWAYSLDRLELGIMTNQVTRFEMGGKLTVPVIKSSEGKPTEFAYKALRGEGGDYLFNVGINDNLKLPAFAADLTLHPGSSIVVKERDGKFYPSAILNGDLSIGIEEKGPKASFASIAFEGMVISSEAPKFQIKAIGLGSGEQNNVSKFPVVINNISVKNEGADRMGLSFDLAVNIGGKPEEEGFKGSSSLTVWGKEEITPVYSSNGQVTGNDTDWVFEKVEMSRVHVEVRKPNKIELIGDIAFFDEDQVYGDGFMGEVNAKFGPKGIEAYAKVLFGKKPDYRYWFADAMVTMPKGIPLGPGLNMNGFGGGYFSNMTQSTAQMASQYGKTESGIYYVPDPDALGLKAAVSLSSATEGAFEGKVAFTLDINRHGGINSVTFNGSAEFMNEGLGNLEEKVRSMVPAAIEGQISQNSDSGEGSITGDVMLHYDNLNKVFHGNLEIYVNVAGGLLRGINPGNKAGWAVIHFEENDWYVHVGTPSQPLGLELVGVFKATSYFMMGRDLPGSPPPPSQVTDLLGAVDLDYMRDFNALQSGNGFAFGLGFNANTGEKNLAMFYGNFNAGTGIDMMLKNYGSQYHCQGSSGPMGINGWYANGQAYAYLSGKIGVNVNLKFHKGKYNILDIKTAALLQAKGPNPFWMMGSVGGYYEILGGLVKGQCKFDVVVGEDCKPVGEEQVLAGVDMIAGITPLNNAKEVDVFVAPQVAFNIPVGEIFEITDEQGVKRSFRAVLEEFSVTDGGVPVKGSLEWNQTNDVVIFDGWDILPGNKELMARAKLVFEENKGGNWTKVKFDGKIVEETVETSFTTGAAPDYIPENNVLVSYPINEQLNFYPKEYNKGFIELKDGQPYLFEPGEEWEQKVRFSATGGDGFVDTGFTYNADEKTVNFNLPDGFSNAQVYRFEIVNIPRTTGTVIDANVTRVETELSSTDPEMATLTTKNLEGEVTNLELKSIYSSRFRTSKYNTFTDKMKSVSLGQTFRLNRAVNVIYLMAYVKGDEYFDEPEIYGGSHSEKLIQMEAITEGNAWYGNYAFPLVYEGYPLLGWMKVNRSNPEELGVPPVRDVYFDGFETGVTLGNPMYESSQPGYDFEKITYNFGVPVAYDYFHLRNLAANYLVDNPTVTDPRIEKLILEPLPRIRYGEYRLRLNYIIPGIEQKTSEYELRLFNPITDND